MRRDYEYRKDALESGRSIGNITTNADNFDKLVTEVEELLQAEYATFFKFRITEWRQPSERPA